MTTYRQFTDQHKSGINRFIHMAAFFTVAYMLATWRYGWWTPIFALITLGVWGRIGHFFEGNKPAFFSRPWEIPLLILYDGVMAVETLCLFIAGAFNDATGTPD